jgi:hypothetical protein
MFRVVFANDDDIECEGDNLGVPADDFCQSRTFDPYLRVYAIVVGDFEYADYSQNPPVKILWLALTLFGAVILLNVLIASKLQAVLLVESLPYHLHSLVVFNQLLLWHIRRARSRV